jgi:hypothetical protein
MCGHNDLNTARLRAMPTTCVLADNLIVRGTFHVNLATSHVRQARYGLPFFVIRAGQV